MSSIDLGRLLNFDHMGFCTELTEFDIEGNHQLLNDDGMIHIPQIFKEDIIVHKVINNNYSITITDDNGHKNIPFQKLNNGIYLIEGSQLKHPFFKTNKFTS